MKKKISFRSTSFDDGKLRRINQNCLNTSIKKYTISQYSVVQVFTVPDISLGQGFLSRDQEWTNGNNI